MGNGISSAVGVGIPERGAQQTRVVLANGNGGAIRETASSMLNATTTTTTVNNREVATATTQRKREFKEWYV
jgi:hypothetical protein